MWTEAERKLAASNIFLIIMQAVMLYKWSKSNTRLRLPRRPYTNNVQLRGQVLNKIFGQGDRVCHEQLRMNIGSFERLCVRLQGLGLADNKSVTVREQVAMFLLTVGHDWRNRSVLHKCHRSGQTVSRYFHEVLKALLKLYVEVVLPPTQENGPWECEHQRPYENYFKDAIGALDGTHFKATVPIEDQPRYRNRKSEITQNVLVACTFNMMFTYVLAGWEGSAHDGRVLRCAVSRQGRRLTIPKGKYYLADAGYAHAPGFMTPYRRVRYHLREQENHDARDKYELFNFRHSSLRNVVERSIGVLKKRFAFLRHAPFHDIRTQSKIILACCALHNWLRMDDPGDDLEGELTSDSSSDEEDDVNVGEPVVDDYEYLTIASTTEWTAKREAMANQMWNDEV